MDGRVILHRSDYTGVDGDSDGIGDTSYAIPDGSN